MNLDFAASPELVRIAALAVFRDLDWPSEDRGHSISAREDPVRLCCRSAPVGLNLRITGHGSGSRVAMHGEVAGYGPLASRSLTVLDAVASRIVCRVAQDSAEGVKGRALDRHRPSAAQLVSSVIHRPVGAG